MRILKLGSWNLTFNCPDCGTLFEISTDELSIDSQGKRYIRCPLCDKELHWHDEKIEKLLEKKEGLL